MADKHELSVSVTGEVLIKGIESTLVNINKLPPAAMKAGKAIDDMGKGPYKIIGILPPLNNVQKGLGNAAIQAQKLDSSLGKNLVSGSNSATQALTNLGRVAQDAPFGFIGIANNLNPLLESFQRLKKESGSTGGALKALAGSLAGGGGIGLAFSVVTAAISFASIGMQAWGGKNKEAKAAVDENKKATEEFAKSLKQVEAQGVAAGIQLKNFVNIAKDQTQSLATRNEALEQANKILGDHGDKLTLVNIATKEVTEQIEKFTQATIQQALATKFADRSADLFINQKAAAKEYGVELAKLNVLKTKTLSFENAQGVRVLTDAGKEVVKQQALVATLATKYKGVTGELKGIVSELSAAQLAASQLFGSLDGAENITGIIAKIRAEIKRLTEIQPTIMDEAGIKSNVAAIKKLQDELDRLLGQGKFAEKVKKDVRTVNDVLSELGRKIQELNAEEFTLNTDKAQDRVSAFLAAIKELVVKYKLDPDGKIVKDLFNDAKLAQLGFVLEKGMLKLGVRASKAFRDGMKDIAAPEEGFTPPEIPVNVDFSKEERAAKRAFLAGQKVKKGFASGMRVPVEMLNDAELEALVRDTEAKIAQFNEAISASLQSLTNDTFQAFADSLSNLFSGQSAGDIFGGFFKTVLTSLGPGLQKMGIQLLAANKAIQLAKATFGKALGVPGSIGLIVLGGLIKSLAAKIRVPGFANGVQNFSGGLAVVGERGPELVNLPRGSDVIPNHALAGSFGGNGMDVTVHGEIAGDRLLLIMDRAQKRQGRQT